MPEGLVFDSRWVLNPSDRTMVLGSTQAQTEISTMDLRWVVKAASA